MTPEVGVVTLTEQDATQSSSLPGRVVAVETSEVRPQINGLIRRRFFEEGSLVKAGQVLYEIEDTPYRAALGSANGQMAVAQASIRSTALQADRYKRLIDIKGVSQQDLDNAVAAADVARATLQARRADVSSAQVNLGFTRVRAPISGRIGRSLVTVGGLAQTGQSQPLATISKIDQVYVDVTEPAGKLLDLTEALKKGSLSREGKAGAKVELTLPNGKIYPVKGQLEFTEPTVDGSSGSVTVRARFANADGVLLPGMYVRARVTDGVIHRAVMAPQRGVTHDEHGDAVALVMGAGGKVAQRKLVLGEAQGDAWVVESGLKAGDRLIVEGQLNVKPGDAATAVPAGQAAAKD
ncbi:efflux RND transporter periplasmic adaptor subunit [Novosphingobium rosa]|uniref:efflux RND transporter periplasmic adaptor subunit n=1 Tax=Novosphingobium rosa TaxID=76978 RepID=UPI000B0D05C9|nr:efflux RND transporter periplasmic adaptor subunit [Novosphingobium rosa]